MPDAAQFGTRINDIAVEIAHQCIAARADLGFVPPGLEVVESNDLRMTVDQGALLQFGEVAGIADDSDAIRIAITVRPELYPVHDGQGALTIFCPVRPDEFRDCVRH